MLRSAVRVQDMSALVQSIMEAKLPVARAPTSFSRLWESVYAPRKAFESRRSEIRGPKMGCVEPVLEQWLCSAQNGDSPLLTITSMRYRYWLDVWFE